MTNLLRALTNLQALNQFHLPAHYGSVNRMNSMGIALEYFVKDAFCGSFHIREIEAKHRAHAAHLSYMGNDLNPPDFILMEGDAIEVKKLETPNFAIALNSSPPKHKLYRDDPRINAACRNIEGGAWTEKDIIYAVGVIPRGELVSLWLVYGDCYAAERGVYETVRRRVIQSIRQADEIDPPVTRELGRVNRVDPLGITYMRIRGMWGIENPARVFSYLDMNRDRRPVIIALMREEKFNSFLQSDREELSHSGASITDVEIKNPDNPANYLKAKLIQLSH